MDVSSGIILLLVLAPGLLAVLAEMYKCCLYERNCELIPFFYLLSDGCVTLLLVLAPGLLAVLAEIYKCCLYEGNGELILSQSLQKP
jgi:hypothetical protein